MGDNKSNSLKKVRRKGKSNNTAVLKTQRFQITNFLKRIGQSYQIPLEVFIRLRCITHEMQLMEVRELAPITPSSELLPKSEYPSRH
jgi:hypothetical protein